ncbi:hypothetical protein ACLMJK_004291 [Lecanora helva]
MSSQAAQALANGSSKKGLYCLTICGFRKPGMSEEDFKEYMTNTHGRISKDLLAKYGMVRWTLSFQTTESRKAMASLYGPQFNKVAEYDFFSQSFFDDLDVVVRMQQDPYYKEFIQNDHDNFADGQKTRVTIGFSEDYIVGGKAI